MRLLGYIMAKVAQSLKNPPAMQETQVRSLGWEDPLEKEMETCFSTLAWKIPWTAAHQASVSIISSRSLLKLMSIESLMPSNHLNLCRPLLLLPSIFPSIRVYFNESALHIRWPKYWSFSFSISPSNEYSGLISFRIDWFHFLAVQGTLKSLLQYQSSKRINSLVLSFLYDPTLASVHGYWKNRSFDYMGLFWQSNVSAF